MDMLVHDPYLILAMYINHHCINMKGNVHTFTVSDVLKFACIEDDQQLNRKIMHILARLYLFGILDRIRLSGRKYRYVLYRGDKICSIVCDDYRGDIMKLRNMIEQLDKYPLSYLCAESNRDDKWESICKKIRSYTKYARIILEDT